MLQPVAHLRRKGNRPRKVLQRQGRASGLQVHVAQVAVGRRAVGVFLQHYLQRWDRHVIGEEQGMSCSRFASKGKAKLFNPERAALLTKTQQLKQMLSRAARLKQAFCVCPPLLSSSPDTSLCASHKVAVRLLKG